MSFSDKQLFLSIDKVKKRLSRIADIDLLANMLIYLPFEFRCDFFKSFDTTNFSKQYEKTIFEFLNSPDYHTFEYQRLIPLHDANIKLLSLIFRKVSKEDLKKIIEENHFQNLNDLAFLEYAKRLDNLVLEANMINHVSKVFLNQEFKRRREKQKNNFMTLQEFMKLDNSKKNIVLSSANLDFLNDQIIDSFKKQYATYNEEQLINRFLEVLNQFDLIELMELQAITSLLDDKNATFLMEAFFNKICKFECDIQDNFLKLMLYQFRRLGDNTNTLFDISKMRPFSIIHYLNTSSINKDMDNVLKKAITMDQYQKINSRKINQINKLLNKLKTGSQTISENNSIVILSYKLYLIFGYENSIELLNGRFGNFTFDLLFFMIVHCDVKNVTLEKINNSFEPILKTDFIQFLIGDKKDHNTTIRKIFNGELKIIKDEFSNIYNDFERYQQKIGKKIHLNQLLPILKENANILLPNEYKITKEIINNILKSYRYPIENDENQPLNENQENERKQILEACDFYHNYLEKRVVSSIPRVVGTSKTGYTYEVIRLDDPIVMTLGYITGCCFRLNGLSKDFLRYCSESLYARIILIRNKKDEICSMIPIIRNGNVIIGNSIESNSKGEKHNVYHTLEDAFQEIINVSTAFEENPVIACCVSNLHSNVYSNRFIDKNIYPISDNKFYTNYDTRIYMVSSIDGVTKNDFRLYTPEAIYFDERPEVLIYHKHMEDADSKGEIIDRIRSILYQLDMSNQFDSILYFSSYIICSEDWFLKVSYDGISGECLMKDPRAIEEYNTVKKYLETKFSNQSYGSSSISTDDLNIIIPKQLVKRENEIKNH